MTFFCHQRIYCTLSLHLHCTRALGTKVQDTSTRAKSYGCAREGNVFWGLTGTYTHVTMTSLYLHRPCLRYTIAPQTSHHKPRLPQRVRTETRLKLYVLGSVPGTDSIKVTWTQCVTMRSLLYIRIFNKPCTLLSRIGWLLAEVSKTQHIESAWHVGT